MKGSPRALMPDYLRLFALFGISVVNVQFIAFSALGTLADPRAETVQDALTLWLVNGLALLKTYGLFSFMFGVGLGFLMRSAVRRDLSFGRIYRKRMIGLALLGVAHGCLFFPGDILSIYAITGSILYLLRNWSVQRLLKIGGVLLIVQALVAPLLLLTVPETPPNILAMERAVLTERGFLETVIFRSIGFAFTMPSFVILQGSAALGWFCLGLAAVKSGIIDDRRHPVWRRARFWCLGPGVTFGLAGAAIWQWGTPAHGVIVTVVTAPIATLGYLGLIAYISRPPGRIMAQALQAGGSSLSIYLGQSIILTTLFSNYGLGLWGALDHLSAVLIALFTTASLVVALALWCNIYELGPFE